MFAKLTGTIDSKGDGWLILDISGVGYLVQCGLSTIESLPDPGNVTTLLIETVVREDSFVLYGFERQSERDWFRLLQTVKGVGARVALTILSALPPENLSNAIAAGDRSALTSVGGVGPKLAERIIAELKDKALIAHEKDILDVKSIGGQGSGPSTDTKAVKDAVSALVNLGYSQTESFAVITRVSGKLERGHEVGLLVKLGLKELSNDR